MRQASWLRLMAQHVRCAATRVGRTVAGRRASERRAGAAGALQVPARQPEADAGQQFRWQRVLSYGLGSYSY
eukprot:SAG22_NODE_506_length_9643_cov_5.853206_4_plen_72_part_00